MPTKTVAGAALLFFALTTGAAGDPGVADRPVLQGVDLEGRPDVFEDEISILIREGQISPSQLLLELDREAEIVFEFILGKALFVVEAEDRRIRKLARFATFDSEIRLPPIDPQGSQSLLQVSVDGAPLATPFRIGIAEEATKGLALRIPALRPTILLYDWERGLIVLDPLRLDLTKSLEPEDETSRIPGDGDGPNIDFCPEEMWRSPGLGDKLPQNTCLLNVLPSGKVEWISMNAPANVGYSVKPESLETLIWATAPSNYPIDGVYNEGWGCLRALKIPDFCTVHATGLNAGCCCGVVAITLGRECQWISTGGSLTDWPDCPLM